MAHLGGGAIEMELSKYLRDYSRTIAGKEQLLIGAMAKALEIIPRQLCDNAGFDATNILNKLRQRHALGKLGSATLSEDWWRLSISSKKHDKKSVSGCSFQGSHRSGKF